MLPTGLSAEQMEHLARQFFLPVALIVNYTLLQYVMVFYWLRRREWRVRLLFAVGALGVVCLIPFAASDTTMVENLNDVSEASCMLVFLIQITITGYDLNRKIKFKSIMALTYVAEMLIVVDFVAMLVSLVSVFDDVFASPGLHQELPEVTENLTLAFIFVFRFYCVIMSRGCADLMKNRKVELVCYILFSTHEMPFLILESTTGVSWEYAQLLHHRVTLALCLWVTGRNKLRGGSRSQNRSSAGSVKPTDSGKRRSVGRSSIVLALDPDTKATNATPTGPLPHTVLLASSKSRKQK